MFKTYHALALASLLGIGAFTMPAGTAAAASLPYVQQNAAPMSQGYDALRQDAGMDRDRRRGGWNNNWNGGWDDNWNGRRHWRYRHDRGFNDFGIFFSPLIVGGYGYGGYGYDLDWCTSHRSYNWRTNSWRSYDGRVHYC